MGSPLDCLCAADGAVDAARVGACLVRRATKVSNVMGIGHTSIVHLTWASQLCSWRTPR